MSDRLVQLRKRFGITPDREGTSQDLAVQICALALDLMKSNPEMSIRDSVISGKGSLSLEDQHRILIETNLSVMLNVAVMAMMNCLTTEWHN